MRIVDFAIVMLAFAFTFSLMGCKNPFGENKQANEASKSQTTVSLINGLSERNESEQSFSDLNFNISAPLESSTTFNLNAYSDASCTQSALGTLQSTSMVSPSNSTSVTFSNVSYMLQNAESETIYLKLASTNSTVVGQCSSPILITIKPVVLGQPDFTSNASQTVISDLSFGIYEYKIHSNGTQLVMADYMNSRVLIWNTIPTSILQVPNVVLGQPNFNSNTSNNGGLSASSISYPGGVFISANKLYLTDYGNSRILIWNSIPTTNNQAANIVLGQPDMISNTPNSGGVSPATMNYPWHLFVTSDKLIVSDYGNHRILIWNTLNLTNGQNADAVLGQVNMTSNTSDGGFPATNSIGFKWPYEVTSDGTKIIAADSGNNRVMIWNSFPASNGQAADVVIGQIDFTGNQANKGLATIDSTSINFPSSVYTYQNSLYVADSNNRRILKYSPIPTSNGAGATALFGQSTYATSATGVSKTAIGYVEGLYVDAHRMVLGDAGNNRVLIVPPF
jgi:hypothetical protein